MTWMRTNIPVGKMTPWLRHHHREIEPELDRGLGERERGREEPGRECEAECVSHGRGGCDGGGAAGKGGGARRSCEVLRYPRHARTNSTRVRTANPVPPFAT